MKAKIRGIYATALTKLLLENGFQIVQPSNAIKNRFGINADNTLPDIEINDRRDLQGVVVLGTAEAMESFCSILHESFEDVIIRKSVASINGIYKGIIVGQNEDTLYVRISPDVVGLLKKNEAEDQNEIIVQVEPKRMVGGIKPLLTTQLKIVGYYAILAQKSNGGVSLKINDLRKRTELYVLGKQLAPEGWGIIWREPAAYVPKDFLEKEIAHLTKKLETLKEKKSEKAPCALIEGLHSMDVEFPRTSKMKMDYLRGLVTYTIEGHHFYKSCKGAVSAALEMAEKLLEKGQNRREVEELFKIQLQSEFPDEGSIVDLKHVKLSGAIFRLGQATIESIGNEKIKYCRTIKFNGVYDGLEVAKEAGDNAISETKVGEWYIKTDYFSKDKKWKGRYININTPVEIYPKAIRYVDLEVDVCIKPDGETKILDVEKIEKALEKGVIGKSLFEKVKATTETILSEKL